MCREKNRMCDFSFSFLCRFSCCNFVAFYRCLRLNYRLLSVVGVSPQSYRNYRFPWGHNSFDTKFMFPDENPRVKCAKQFFLLSNLQI